MYRSALIFVSLSMLAFIVDIDFFFTNHYQFLYLILHIYIFELLWTKNKNRLIFLAFLFGLESFMFYGTIGAPLLLLTILTFAQLQIRHHFYQSWIYALAVGTLFFTGQILIIEPVFLHIPLDPQYTFFKLCANLIIVGMVSLKTIIKPNKTIAQF